MITFLLLIVLVAVLYFAYWKRKDEVIENVKEKVFTNVRDLVKEEKPDKNIEGLIYKKYKI